MKTRAAKFAAAIVASILSSANLLAAPETTEQGADKCLTSPGEKTPPGGHWRYRLERGTARQCWYVKVDGDKSARKAGEETTPADADISPAPLRKKPASTRALSDAHAEFSRIAAEAEDKPAPAQRAPASPPATAAVESPRPPAARDSNVMAPVAATRWPDPTSALNPVVSAAAPVTEQTDDTRSAPVGAVAAPPQVMPRAVPPVPVSEKPLSLPMLITIVAGGLSVFGVIMSMIFGWRSSRPRLTPSAPMPPLEDPREHPRRPGDLYRERKGMRGSVSGRRAA